MSKWRDIIIAIKAISAIIVCIICVVVGLFMAEDVENTQINGKPSIGMAARSEGESGKQHVIDVVLSDDCHWLFTVDKGDKEAAMLVSKPDLLISLSSPEDAIYALGDGRYVAELTDETASKMVSELMRGDSQ